LSASLVRQAVELARGVGIRHAARTLGIDRNTVRRYVRTAAQPDKGTDQPAAGGGEVAA
jgi:hypothetical protein